MKMKMKRYEYEYEVGMGIGRTIKQSQTEEGDVEISFLSWRRCSRAE
jgi:hypothetical protein